MCGYEEVTLANETGLVELSIDMDNDLETRFFSLEEMFVNSDPTCPITDYYLKKFMIPEEGDGLMTPAWSRNFWLNETSLGVNPVIPGNFMFYIQAETISG